MLDDLILLAQNWPRKLFLPKIKSTQNGNARKLKKVGNITRITAGVMWRAASEVMGLRQKKGGVAASAKKNRGKQPPKSDTNHV